MSGSILWEPPGGGIEPGETAHEAARRELREETGLVAASVGDRSIPVVRDVWWAGHHFDGTELFFAADVTGTAVESPQLSDREQTSLLGQAWFSWAELRELDEHVEPPELADVLAELVPDDPWAPTER